MRSDDPWPQPQIWKLYKSYLLRLTNLQRYVQQGAIKNTKNGILSQPVVTPLTVNWDNKFFFVLGYSKHNFFFFMKKHIFCDDDDLSSLHSKACFCFELISTAHTFNSNESLSSTRTYIYMFWQWDKGWGSSHIMTFKRYSLPFFCILCFITFLDFYKFCI